MEINQFLKNIRKEEKIEGFVALEIGLDKLRAGIWTVKGDSGAIACVSAYYPFEFSAKSDLLKSSGSAIEECRRGFSLVGEDINFNQVIFGLGADWIENGEISESKMDGLKEISEKHHFRPLGFVFLDEAIAHLLKITEGIPPTIILLNIQEEVVGISLINLGKITGTQIVKRSDDLGADLEEGLSRIISDKSLPVRIVVAGSIHEKNIIENQLINYRFSGIAFLHLPKVEFLSSDFSLKALAWAGSREATKNIKEIVSKASMIEDPTSPSQARLRGASTEDTKDARDTEDMTVQGDDDAGEKQDEKDTDAESVFSDEPEDFGFIKNKDIVEVMPVFVDNRIKEEPAKELVADIVEGIGEDRVGNVVLTERGKFNLGGLFAGLKRKKESYGYEGSIAAGPKFRSGRLVAVGMLLILLAVGGGIYWYLPKASVVLFVNAKSITKSFTVTIDTAAKVVDQLAKVLPGKEVEAVLEETGSVATTGIKVVGTPAIGEVTIYNLTSKIKIFPKGTIFTGQGGLKFTLDKEVSVASASSSTDPGYKKVIDPGRSMGGVTATAIGPEGNLASGNEFLISGFSKDEYVAKNGNALSGGTKREIQAVSKNDEDNLVKELAAKALEKSIGEITGKLAGEDRLVDKSIISATVSRQFSRKVGEEADKLDLILKIKFTGLTYQESDLRLLNEEEIKKMTEIGYQIVPDSMQSGLAIKEAKGRLAVFENTVSAKLSPEINTGKIRDDIAGKKIPFAMSYLGNNPAFASYRVEFSPSFVEKFGSLPKIRERISVKVEVN